MFSVLRQKNLPISSGIFTTNYTQRAYQTDPVQTVFAIIQKKAQFLSMLNESVTLDGEPVENYLTDIMANPNSSTTWQQLEYAHYWWQFTSGNTYIFTPKDNRGVPIEYWVLPSPNVTINANTERITSYTYKQNANQITIPVDEIIHIKKVHPSINFDKNYLYGTPIELNKSLDLMNLEVSALEFVQSFLDSDGVSPYVLSAKENLQPDLLKKLKAGFNETILNNKYHVQAIMGAGATVEPLAKSSHADGLAVKQSESVVKAICTIWGTPENILTLDFNGKALIEGALENWYQGTLKPDKLNFQQAINKQLSEFDRAVYKIEDYKVNDTEELRKQELHDFSLGLATINELRAKRGLQSISNGDIPMIAGSYYPLGDLLMVDSGSEKKKTLGA
jgi:HK97 family phage portal protein